VTRPVRYQFGHFELHPGERRLWAAGKALSLTPRAFDVLVALVERPGQLVSKDALLDRVWPGLVVEENNLQVQVSTLRKVLGPAAIETVPGHGYRFLPKVQGSGGDEASPPNEHRHNLPRALTRFIGHEDDLAKCARLLDRSRLVTITGVGGLGKSRLSLEMAGASLENFADGVWLVELAPLADAQLVSRAVASVFGIIEQVGRPLLEVVTSFARDRRLLLVLDNCEHLLRACAEVAAQLLRACPYVKILASSREPLHVPGEATFSLPTLAIPGAGEDLSPAALSDYESIRLFVDRATAALPDFRLTDANARSICEICVHLDGIPLAIELAAARVRVLSVQAIAERLNDRFRLLKGGDLTALPRQQTLRATLDWSYELLTGPEQLLLHRTAVFSGGWTLEAIEAVGAGGDVDVSDVLDLNGRLTEKSLVIVEREGARYRLLETVRQYAHERLEASGEGDATRARHLAFYLALAEAAEPRLVSRDEGTWHGCLDLERENFRSAWTCCQRTAEAESALRLAFALRRWLCRNPFDLGDPVLAGTLALPQVQHRDLVRSRGLAAAAFLSFYQGRYSDAQRLAEESLSMAVGADAAFVAADALTILGFAHTGQGQSCAARACLAEAVVRARKAANVPALVEALNGLGEDYSTEGDLAQAESYYEEALAEARCLGSRDFINVVIQNLARIATSRGSLERARELLCQAVALFDETGSTRNAQVFFTMAAGFAAKRGDWVEAARFVGTCSSLLERMGLHRDPADEAFLAPLIAKARDAMGEAAFADAEHAGRERSCEDVLAEAGVWLRHLA
jgi:predicted ATPase/DNA-binding winged helix-turn-helix (wHTH) protein